MRLHLRAFQDSGVDQVIFMQQAGRNVEQNQLGQAQQQQQEIAGNLQEMLNGSPSTLR